MGSFVVGEFVHRGQTERDLTTDVEADAPRQWKFPSLAQLLHVFAQRDATDILHDQKRPLGVLSDVDDRHDVRVAEQSSDARFPKEHPAHFRLVGELRPKSLERVEPLELPFTLDDQGYRADPAARERKEKLIPTMARPHESWIRLSQESTALQRGDACPPLVYDRCVRLAAPSPRAVSVPPRCRAPLLWLLLTHAMAGCAPPQTIIVLDGTAPIDAERVEVVTCTQDGTEGSRSTVPSSALVLPHRVPVEPISGDQSRVFRFVATFLDASDTPLASVTAVAGFPRDGRIEVDRTFDARCVGVACDALETCIDGACTSAVEPDLALTESTRLALSACRAGALTNDAGPLPMDSGTIREGGADSGPPDAGPSCDPTSLPSTCPPESIAGCLPAGCEVVLGQPEPTRGMNEANVPPERQRVTLRETPVSATVAGFYIHLFAGRAAGSTIRVVLYANSEALGTPFRRLMISEDTDVRTSGPEDAWFYIPLQGSGRLPAGTYWLGFAGQDLAGSGGRLRYGGRTIAASETRLGNGVFEEGAPDPWEDWPMATTTAVDYEVVAVGAR